MFRYAFALTLCLGMMAGCSSDNPTASKLPAKPEVSNVTVGDYTLQAPIYAGSVALVPVSMNKPIPQQDGNFITLSEARKEGSVEITEMESEDVNTLKVENKGTRPLLLLGGDLLMGGKQDRIVARDVIVPPGKTVNVEVFCVEHGRWDNQSEHFEFKETVVPNDVRQAAAHDGQSEVWAEVDDYNSANGNFGGSLSVSKGLSTEKVQKSVKEHEPKVLEALKTQKNVVGFIYVRNGELQSMDLFGNPKVFDIAKGSLLKGFLADGASIPAKKDAEVDMNACRKFLEHILKDQQAKPKKAERAGKSVAYETSFARGVVVGSLPEAGKDSTLVHGNYSPKK